MEVLSPSNPQRGYFFWRKILSAHPTFNGWFFPEILASSSLPTFTEGYMFNCSGPRRFFFSHMCTFHGGCHEVGFAGSVNLDANRFSSVCPRILWNIHVQIFEFEGFTFFFHLVHGTLAFAGAAPWHVQHPWSSLKVLKISGCGVCG